jgi:hypothetical protein
LTFDLAWHEYHLPVLPDGGKYSEGEELTVENYLLFITQKTNVGPQLEMEHYGTLPPAAESAVMSGLLGSAVRF